MKPQLNTKHRSLTETIASRQSAILYVRVSTDEQATKGYSLRTQEERLVKYCASNEIEIIDIISEDYSAKTFKRPSWSKLMAELKHSKPRPDLIIFTRWDRFSRNAADEYYMITHLRKLGIEVKGIDQPLDLSISENKIMLALYIAASEVENDRRSLNVRNGMRKAKQEGRWMGGAPLGYIMRATGTGRKQLVPHDPEATLVRSIFNRVAENSSSLKLLYRQFVQAGLKCCYANLCLLLHNPVYCGKIIIAEPENETSYEVKGQHEALISVKVR
jgi:DNA invertase Pin-like site-specific DNA recombinase